MFCHCFFFFSTGRTSVRFSPHPARVRSKAPRRPNTPSLYAGLIPAYVLHTYHPPRTMVHFQAFCLKLPPLTRTCHPLVSRYSSTWPPPRRPRRRTVPSTSPNTRQQQTSHKHTDPRTDITHRHQAGFPQSSRRLHKRNRHNAHIHQKVKTTKCKRKLGIP